MQINLDTSLVWIFVCICSYILILFGRNLSQRNSLARDYPLLFADTYTLSIRYVLLVGACISILIMLFDITSSDRSEPGKSNKDIVFVLDVSKSMLTQDTPQANTSRLDTAKYHIREYVLEYPDHRYSLVIFAGNALSISPLSSNIDHFLTGLSRVGHQQVLHQGSELSQALMLGYERFTLSEKNSTKALVLISDGGDDVNSEPLRSSDIPSMIIGVGSKKGGPIPLGFDAFGNQVFQKYQGETVISSLNKSTLRQLASETKAEYGSLEDMPAWLDHISPGSGGNSGNTGAQRSYHFVFAWIALLLLTGYLLLPYTKLGKK